MRPTSRARAPAFLSCVVAGAVGIASGAPPPGEKSAPTASAPQACQSARTSAERLLAELQKTVPAAARAGGAQYVAKPAPGSLPAKAWGDYAAAALLAGDPTLAALAGLEAAAARWNGETVTNAGIYLHHLGKPQEALHLLLCAIEMGYRSPYLFEALAVIYQSRGEKSQARDAIQKAQHAAADDALIEAEASYINTGQPPRPRPPQREPDGLDEALRELEEHARRVLELVKAQADEIDKNFSDGNAREFARAASDYLQNVLPPARDMVRQARAADPAVLPTMVNGAFVQQIYLYGQITDTLLGFQGITSGSGNSLFFWADALGLDAANLARETGREYSPWAFESPAMIALAMPAFEEYQRERDANWRDHNERVHACTNEPCKIRETARWCGVWKQIYERWGDKTRQRHSVAARRFDRVATRRLIEAENEILRVRDYGVRQLKRMRFPRTPGVDLEQAALTSINTLLRGLYEKHLGGPGTQGEVVDYLRGRATWFEGARKLFEQWQAEEADNMKTQCQPALRALLELLAQEEWQAYLDHLRDRLRWDIQSKTESELPCEGSIGPLAVTTDFNKPGEGKFDVKWRGKSFQGGVGVTTGGTVSAGAGGSGKGISIGATGDSAGGVGGSAGFGPFSGKGKITLTDRINPYDSQEYLGIKLKGSAGLGLKSGKLGAACYPSSGSVTIYPRALLKDAVEYLSAPSTPPPGGRPR